MKKTRDYTEKDIEEIQEEIGKTDWESEGEKGKTQAEKRPPEITHGEVDKAQQDG